MIYEVEKSALGLQIVLTRTHTEFVKKVFELEVPEIYDRTIEIHKMVREPGYRTKMSVYSTRDDVDPVGACVGMRGVRIQTVVREMEGEKIDVLRYDPDVRSFITEALKPAEVEQVIVLDEAKRQALAVVPESQFSLAIGKQGLNVRLANRLTDWSIDVRTRAQVNEMDIGADSQRAAAALFGEVQEEITDVAELPGIVPRVAAALKASGVELLETLVALDEAQLRAVPELSEADVGDLRKLIEENVEIVEEEPPADESPADEVVPAEEPAAAAAAMVAEAAAAAPHSTAVDAADTVAEAAPEVAEEPEEVVRASELPGMPEGIAAALAAAGLDDVVELVSMSEAELGAVEGLSDTDVTTLLQVIEENVEVVEEDVEQETAEDSE
jgi:N utilization substance protein A